MWRLLEGARNLMLGPTGRGPQASPLAFGALSASLRAAAIEQKPIPGNFLRQLVYPLSGPIEMLVERRRRS